MKSAISWLLLWLVVSKATRRARRASSESGSAVTVRQRWGAPCQFRAELDREVSVTKATPSAGSLGSAPVTRRAAGRQVVPPLLDGVYLLGPSRYIGEVLDG